ncbi:MAG: DUF4054 domain-containing protein [Desulfovibrio sp.]|jgi:hypothetical protein|nr:DUF4054 domain-containing protein [Desulfovibrio sp.]
MAVVVFDPEEFRTMKPQFADFTDAQLGGAFDLACELVDNGERSPVPYDPPEVRTRKALLYALVCHFCELDKRGGMVGIMTGAAEGSVNVTFTPPPVTDANSAWYMQTQCGATAWMLLRRYALGGRLYNGRFR